MPQSIALKRILFLPANGSIWDDTVHDLDTTKGRLSVAAAACEWMTCLLIVTFCFTFVPEFRHYEVKRASVTRVESPAASRRRRNLNANGNEVASPVNINVTFTTEGRSPVTEEESVLMTSERS